MPGVQPQMQPGPTGGPVATQQQTAGGHHAKSSQRGRAGAGADSDAKEFDEPRNLDGLGVAGKRRMCEDEFECLDEVADYKKSPVFLLFESE